MHNPLLDRFPGVIGFPVTPFTRKGEFDADGFAVNVEFLLGSGLAALAFCGSNGELQSITLDEYRAVTDIASSLVAGRKGLLFGVGQTLRTAQEQARLARRAGVPSWGTLVEVTGAPPLLNADRSEMEDGGKRWSWSVLCCGVPIECVVLPDTGDATADREILVGRPFLDAGYLIGRDQLIGKHVQHELKDYI